MQLSKDNLLTSSKEKPIPASSLLPNQWDDFVARFDSYQTAYLKALLENKSERELKSIASKLGKLHDLFVDEFNSIGNEIPGEPLIEDWVILEEYDKTLRAYLFQ